MVCVFIMWGVEDSQTQWCSGFRFHYFMYRGKVTTFALHPNKLDIPWIQSKVKSIEQMNQWGRCRAQGIVVSIPWML